MDLVLLLSIVDLSFVYRQPVPGAVACFGPSKLQRPWTMRRWSYDRAVDLSLLVNKIYLHTESRDESSYAHKVTLVAVTLTPRTPHITGGAVDNNVIANFVFWGLVLVDRCCYWSVNNTILSSLSRNSAWTWMEECPSHHQGTMTPFSTSGIPPELHPSHQIEPPTSSQFLIRSEQPLGILQRTPRDRSRRLLKGWTWMPKEPRTRWICPSTLSPVVNIWLVQMVST